MEFVFAYWDWLKENNYTEKDCKNRNLLNEFYHTEFNPKHPDYNVNGLEYFCALGIYLI